MHAVASMAKRPLGSGSVYQLPSGRYVARIKDHDGQRRSLGTFVTEEEAHEAADGAAALLLEQGEVYGQHTVTSFGALWLDHCERQGERDIANKRRRFGYATQSTIGLMRLGHVRRSMVVDWAATLQTERNLSAKTTREALGVLRRMFAHAVLLEKLDANPCDYVTISKRGEQASAERWTYLTMVEQQRLVNCEKIPLAERLRIGFAIGTGLRASEQHCLQWADVDLDSPRPHVIVRWGKPNQAPKNGKIRRVPLFGLALDCAQRWRALHHDWLTGPLQHDCVWPTQRGYRRRLKPYKWPDYREAAGIDRVVYVDHRGKPHHVRWHDLRHTTASALVSGMWGPAWALSKVRDFMGHTSVTVTERYAHLSPDALAAEAAQTGGPSLSLGAPLKLVK